jgi:hypothetical protein
VAARELARTVVATLCLVGAAAGAVCAQEPSPPADKPRPSTDIWDLLARARHRPTVKSAGSESSERLKPRFVTAPIIGHKPSTGPVLGVGESVAFYRGDPGDTRISSAIGGLRLSFKKQLLLNLGLNLFTSGDRWYFQSDNTFNVTAQDTFGLGPHIAPDQPLNTKFRFQRFYETIYRRVGRGLFAGPGLHVSRHTNVKPAPAAEARWDESPYVAYSAARGFDLASQASGGASVNALFDSRDDEINPDRGLFASASYRAFAKGFLGGDSNWQELYIDLRSYVRATKDARHKVAFRIYADLVTSGIAPYFDLPATGMDASGRSGRGNSEGRFRGEQLAYGEIEYRATLLRNGLVGMVAFLNTTTVSSSETGEKLFDDFLPGAGFGFRLLIDKKSRTNLCLDFGWGRQRSHGVYLSVQEAF